MMTSFCQPIHAGESKVQFLCLGEWADGPPDGGAIAVRQHQVEKDQIGAVLLGQPQAFLSQFGGEDGVSAMPDSVLEQLERVGVIFDQEDHRHGRQDKPRYVAVS
jgi:hypothetical protein